jgi:hypothetical protein
MKVTIRFAGDQISPELPAGSTLSCIKSNKGFAAAMGFDPNAVAFIVNGSAAGDQTVLSAGDIISVQHRAHEKAA